MIPTDYEYNDSTEQQWREEVDYDTVKIEEELDIDSYNFYPDAAF